MKCQNSQKNTMEWNTMRVRYIQSQYCFLFSPNLSQKPNFTQWNEILLKEQSSVPHTFSAKNNHDIIGFLFFLQIYFFNFLTRNVNITNQTVFEQKQTFYNTKKLKYQMRKSSLNTIIKLIYQKHASPNLNNYQLNQSVDMKQPNRKLFSESFLHINKVTYSFSNSNKEPTNQPQKQENQKQYASKHREMQEAQEYSKNAQMNPEGQKPDQNKDSPFIPTAAGNYVIAISAACLILAYAVMQVQFMRASNAKKSPAQGAKKVVAKGKAHIGGDWQLIGTDGKPVSYKDFQGKYYLIYFGFCNCPDICPNSLMKLAKALEKVKKTSEARFFNLESVFVSVDPDRDTPQKIDNFAKYFDKSMIGVTGKSNDDPALKDCMRKFKIYSSKIEFEDEESVIKGRKSYTIDHTILTYLMNPQNEYVAHIGANMGEHEMAKMIMQKIKEDQRASMQKLKV